MLDKYHGWWKVQYNTLKTTPWHDYHTHRYELWHSRGQHILDETISKLQYFYFLLLRKLTLSALPSQMVLFIRKLFSVIEEKSNSHSVPHHNQHSNLYLREKKCKTLCNLASIVLWVISDRLDTILLCPSDVSVCSCTLTLFDPEGPPTPRIPVKNQWADILIIFVNS